MYARPTDRVGIIGIGGLGHMAVKFATAYGCDVTAFTSSESKFEEAKGFGAHQAVSSKDSAAIKKLAGSLDRQPRLATAPDPRECHDPAGIAQLQADGHRGCRPH